MKTKVYLLQTLARNHIGGADPSRDSAASAYWDGTNALDTLADPRIAAAWLLRSLAHSVGICHSDYQFAFRLLKILGEIRTGIFYWDIPEEEENK